MRGMKVERVLAATALAIVLAIPVSRASEKTAQDTASTTADIEAKVPLPESANLPPPSIADVGGPVTASGPDTAKVAAPPSKSEATSQAAPQSAVKSASIDGLVPMPGTDFLPPLTAADVGKVPFAGVASADIPISDKLDDLVAKRLDRFAPRKPDRVAIQAFYKERNYKPLWIENQKPTARAEAAVARLKRADTDGLDSSDYATPDLNSLKSPDALAEGELKLTVAVMTFARHAQSGRVHPWRISANIDYKLSVPEPEDILAEVAASKDIAATLESFNPPHAGFKALKAKLAELHKPAVTTEVEIVHIPEGKILRPGMEDPRVVLLRKRLEISGNPQSAVYDDAVFEAVKEFQASAGVGSDGMLGSNTLRALNGKQRARSVNRTEAILVNMERWRWLPRELGRSYSMLNIPDFSLKVVSNGATVWHTKVVVGKPSTPTPIFSHSMKFITVNPIWNVPPSIIYNEYLPALDQDPSVMDRMGIRVTSNDDGSIRMYQPPGDRNALGRLRFNFPNKFLVYQHDTPDKHLFDKTSRAYSHGCMRVQDPLKYAEVLLSLTMPKEGYTQERLRRMYGSEEININFPNPLPVHITYQTAFVDNGGNLVIRDDIYGIDARVEAALKGNYLTAELAPPPEPRRDSANPQRYRSNRDYSRYTRYGRNWYGREARGGFNFFDFFFQ